MAHYALILHQEYCPDGAELAPGPGVEGTRVRWPDAGKKRPASGRRLPVPAIRFRTDRRQQLIYRLSDPDDLVVTKLINAAPIRKDGYDDYTELLAFVSQWGFPHMSKGFKQAAEGADILDDCRRVLLNILNEYKSGDVVGAIKRFQQFTFAPQLTADIQLRNGTPILTLPLHNLFSFMLMETALVITGGAQVMACEQCSSIFVTGPGTGRRATSKYCSNRCRVAAQRNDKGD